MEYNVQKLVYLVKYLYKELLGHFWAAKAKVRLAQCTESQM